MISDPSMPNSRLQVNPDAVWVFFRVLPKGTFKHYRDAIFSAPRFDLNAARLLARPGHSKSLGLISWGVSVQKDRQGRRGYAALARALYCT